MQRLLFILMLFSVSNLFGQFQIPFPNDPTNEAVWTQRRYTPPDPATPQFPQADYFYTYNNFGIDTIEGIQYNRLYQDWAGPIGHYRIDSLKVYYRSDYAAVYSPDQHGAYIPGGGEYLLYDFGLSVGDTFQIVPNGEIVLNEIDSILIDGFYYRTFHFNEPYPWYQPLEYYWIEGIGSSTGFYPVFDYFEDQLYFKCFWNNGLIYYTNGIDCFDESLGIEEEKIGYSIFPNPVTNVLNIETQTAEEINGQLTNLSGQVVLTFKLSGSESLIHVDHLKKGIYFLKLNREIIKILIE
ncbi:MAG: T9SS type A sorting domain-containing protein [Crocinitomicaceae bacterium]|nr:T9SS type A sorting domain-containing protein [Flavobacteriales bacterium]NQZ35319.1 T9SS type A sorting domain-containing protein [Crocinitomicaceae bacterium]